jgi:penicillin-binding protein-related factor A (putative recombinase)
MKEKNFQTLFGKWLNERKTPYTAVFELKIVKNKVFTLGSVKNHQLEGLSRSLRQGIYHKISDSPIYAGSKSRFTLQKPFDCLWIKAKEAYVAVLWYIPRKPKIVTLIDINEFEKIILTWKKKSIRLEELQNNYNCVTFIL